MDDTTTAVFRAGPRRRERLAGPPPRDLDVLEPRGGGVLTVRRVDRRDTDAVALLHRHCSAASLRGRYRTPGAGTAASARREADALLAHLLSPRFGHTLAAFRDDGTTVGLGQLLWDGEDEAEVALLVADSWQRRGVGAGLLRRLVGTAGQRGVGCVYAVAAPPGAGASAVMRTLGLPLDVRHEEEAVVITARRVPGPREPGRSAPPMPHGRRCGRR